MLGGLPCERPRRGESPSVARAGSVVALPMVPRLGTSRDLVRDVNRAGNLSLSESNDGGLSPVVSINALENRTACLPAASLRPLGSLRLSGELLGL